MEADRGHGGAISDQEIRFLEGLLDAGVVPTLDGEPMRIDSPAFPPGPFGRYEILTKVGQGGCGSVYRARDGDLNRIVALKILERVPTEDAVQRFIREAQIMAKLHHENIVSVHELVCVQGQYGIAMEFVEGGSLVQELQLRRKPLGDLVRVVERAAEALDYAHKNGIVHRDVKPGNILLDGEGRTRVADFGLARLSEPEARLTISGAWMGTPAYMPPEQASGSAHDSDARADVYSLGVILYEILAGRLPFAGSGSAEIIRKIQDEEPEPPRKVDPHVPRDLEIVCLKAMEKERERRYATAGELAADLRRFLNGEPIEAVPPSFSRRIRRFVRRHPRFFVVSAFLSLAASCAGGLWLNRYVEARRHAEQERRLLERQSRLERAEEIGRAIANWDASLSARPDDVDFPSLLLKMRSLEADLERLRLEDPSIAAVHYHLGRAARRRGRTEEARSHLDEALRLRPEDAAALLERGLLQLQTWSQDYLWTRLAITLMCIQDSDNAVPIQREMPSGAIGDLEEAVRAGLSPVYADYAQTTIALARAGDRETLETAAQRVTEFEKRRRGEIDLLPLKADLHYFLGSLILSQYHDSKAAVTELDIALEIRRSFPEAYAQRAICRSVRFYGLSEQPTAAESKTAAADAQRAMEMNPDYFGGYVAAGMVHLTEEFAKVRPQLRRGGEIPPSEAAGIVTRLQEAIDQDFDPALRFRPSNASIYFCRSHAFLLCALVHSLPPAGEKSKCVEFAQRALKDLEEATRRSGKGGWYIEFERCMMYRLTGDVEAMTQAGERALKLATDGRVDSQWIERIKKVSSR